jgi:hypothetical protein
MDLTPHLLLRSHNPTNTGSKKYAREKIPSHPLWNAASADAYKRGILNKKTGKYDE